MTARVFWIIALSALLLPHLAMAQEPGDTEGITLEVITRDAARDQINLAVPDAYDTGGAHAQIAASISVTLRRDLNLACYFNLLGPASFFFNQHADGMEAPNYENWRAVNADGLVKTAIRVAGDTVYLDFRLFDIATGSRVDLGWAPSGVTADDVDGQVHAFANEIIRYYSGMAGPFGTRVAMVGGSSSGREIYVMTIGGSGPGSITNNGSINIEPGWASGQVLYTTYIYGNPDLVRGGGPNPTVIANYDGLNVGGTLSPDGSAIAVTLTRDGQAEIYLISPDDGSIISRLTSNSYQDVEATWSPSGDQIAFASDRSGGVQIYIMNRDGSGVRRATFAGDYNTSPDWSSDGNYIAFTGRDAAGRQDVFVVDAETNDIYRVTQDQGSNESPTWSPDGQFLIFTSNRNGGDDLWMSTADGGLQVQVTRGGNFTSPVWSR